MGIVASATGFARISQNSTALDVELATAPDPTHLVLAAFCGNKDSGAVSAPAGFALAADYHGASVTGALATALGKPGGRWDWTNVQNGASGAAAGVYEIAIGNPSVHAAAAFPSPANDNTVRTVSGDLGTASAPGMIYALVGVDTSEDTLGAWPDGTTITWSNHYTQLDQVQMADDTDDNGGAAFLLGARTVVAGDPTAVSVSWDGGADQAFLILVAVHGANPGALSSSLGLVSSIVHALVVHPSSTLGLASTVHTALGTQVGRALGLDSQVSGRASHGGHAITDMTLASAVRADISATGGAVVSTLGLAAAETAAAALVAGAAAPGQVALDAAAAPAPVQSPSDSAGAQTTETFTAPAGSVLVVLAARNSGWYSGADPSLSVSDTAGLSWQTVAVNNNSSNLWGVTAIFYAVCEHATTTAVTITPDTSISSRMDFAVLVALGVDPTDPLGGWAQGADSANVLVTTAFTAATDGGLGVVMANDWYATGAPTSPDTTLLDRGYSNAQISGAAGYRRGLVAGQPVSFTLDDPSNADARWTYVAAELRAAMARPAAAAPAPDALALTSTITAAVRAIGAPVQALGLTSTIGPPNRPVTSTLGLSSTVTGTLGALVRTRLRPVSGVDVLPAAAGAPASLVLYARSLAVRPRAIAAVDSAFGFVSRTRAVLRGQPVHGVEVLPTPVLDAPARTLRFIAQDIHDGQVLDWDLPLINPRITFTLSGATLIRTTLAPEIDSIAQLGLTAWAHYIHAELDGQIVASGILQPLAGDEHEGLTIEAIGFSAYPKGIPFGSQLGPLVDVDPLYVLRQIWSDLQSVPGGGYLGVLLGGVTQSPIRIGTSDRYQLLAPAGTGTGGTGTGGTGTGGTGTGGTGTGGTGTGGTTPPPDPTAPTAVSAAALDGAAALSWSPPTGGTVTGYTVGRDGTDADGTGPWQTTLAATARTQTFNLLVNGQTYHLFVQASFADGTTGTKVTVATVPGSGNTTTPTGGGTGTGGTGTGGTGTGGTGTGGTGTGGTGTGGTGTGSGGVPGFDHIVVVLYENTNYEDIHGNTGAAPYMNSLEAQGALFTDSHGVNHPSEGNYIALFSGDMHGLTDDSGGDPGLTAPSIWSQLGSGDACRWYSEDLPSDVHSTQQGDWVQWHVAMCYFAGTDAQNLDFSAFPSDFTTLPKVAFVTPNMQDDMHDGPIDQGDSWTRSNIDAYAQWAKANNSLLILTFDEDNYRSQNHIWTLFYGAHVKAGAYSETIDHYDVLRTIEAAFGLPGIGTAANRSPITDCWN